MRFGKSDGIKPAAALDGLAGAAYEALTARAVRRYWPPSWRGPGHKVGPGLLVHPYEAPARVLADQIAREDLPGKRDPGGYARWLAKFRLMDARRDETQGGMVGRHDGKNRSPRTGCEQSAFDSSLDGDAPGVAGLRQRFPEPYPWTLGEQLRSTVQAEQAAFSKPTVRVHLAERLPEMGAEDPYPYGWQWHGGGRAVKPYADHWLPDGHPIEGRLGGWRRADSEFVDLGAILDPAGFEPRTPSPSGRRLWADLLADKNLMRDMLEGFSEEGKQGVPLLRARFGAGYGQSSSVREHRIRAKHKPALTKPVTLVAVQHIQGYSTVKVADRYNVTSKPKVTHSEGGIEDLGGGVVWYRRRRVA